MTPQSFSPEHDALRRKAERSRLGNRKTYAADYRELVHFTAHLLELGRQLELNLTESEPCQ